MADFQTQTKTGIVLQANDAFTINLNLAVGTVTNSVTVSADVPQADTTTSTLSQVVGSQDIVDLPLNGRNAATLMTLVASAVNAP